MCNLQFILCMLFPGNQNNQIISVHETLKSIMQTKALQISFEEEETMGEILYCQVKKKTGKKIYKKTPTIFLF